MAEKNTIQKVEVKSTTLEDYKILESAKPAGLNEQVNEHLAKGWELFGSPYGNVYRLYQAVIKKFKEKLD